ncbi:MAG: Oxygen sensor histidine kinase response regulator DevS/DosS [Chloroflexi bacterium]|nr:Oxygen sensor histidine kinase response regulator DevS/DosS [Chloroflexota bacterium]
MTKLTQIQLEHHLGAFHQVSRDLGSNLSLDTLLERIARLAHAQVQAHKAIIALRDEAGEIENFVHIRLVEGVVKRVNGKPGWGKDRQGVSLPEIGNSIRRVKSPANHPEIAAFLGVPLVSGEKVLGHIYLIDKEDAPEFTPDDERLMKTLAAYATVAITNVRLYQNILSYDHQLNQQNEDLALINDLAQTVANSWDIKEIMSQTLSKVIDYLGVSTGEIYLRDTGGEDLRLSLFRGDDFNAFYPKNIFRVGEGIVGRVAEQAKILVSNSLAEDPRILRPAIHKAGFRSLMGIPLWARRKLVGVMTLFSKSERISSEREFELLTTIGTWAGIAIENVRLQQKSKRMAVLEERERIGMDLHDGIIQSLYSIGLTLDYGKMILENPKESEGTEDVLDRLNLATSGINNAINDIRSYVSDLRPSEMVEGKTLPENLAFILEQFETHSQIKGELEVTVPSLNGLPFQKKATLFHICQEALANTARHSQATEAKVKLWTVDGRAYLKVSDNGKGFNIDTADTSLGHGLSNMQRRVRKAGGDIRIDSAPLKGTTVEVWVPVGGAGGT